jgi:hypothetical protein
MSRFVRNRAFDSEMKADPMLVAQVRRTAVDVAVSVKRVAPDVTGYYKRHIRVQDNLVISDDPFGHLVEAGSVNNLPYAPLRRGARAAGLRLVDPLEEK